jgi:hypothetical protein
MSTAGVPADPKTQPRTACSVAVGPAPDVPVRRQRVRVPMRIVLCPSYPDIALSVYLKVRALGMRPEGCQARASTIARYLGVSTATAERGLTALSRPAPDGIVELHTQRRTLPGGRGQSAVRTTRPVRRSETYVWLAVAAAEDLTARQLRALALIAYAQAKGVPLTEGELAGSLHHHSGKRAGRPLSATAAGLIVDELEAARWVTVLRRTGARGRHQFVAHDVPPAAHDGASGPAPTAETAPSDPADPSDAAAVSSQLGEGSGPQLGEGSLANRESPSTGSPENDGAPSSSAVGEVPVPTGPAPVENRDGEAPGHHPADGLALRADEEFSPRAEQQPPTRGREAAPSPRPYGGPLLSLSAEVHAVLEPVHWLLARVGNDFVVRQIGREAGRQLREGTPAERLHHRLTVRLAGTMMDEIRDHGRWILGAALPRWGCGLQDCESGTLWTTGTPCEVCAEAVHEKYLARRRTRRQEQGLCPEHSSRPGAGGRCVDCAIDAAIHGPRSGPVSGAPAASGPPRGDCGDCGARIMLTGYALDDGLCKPCRTAHQGPSAPPSRALAAGRCSDARSTGGCPRAALPNHQVCARHLARELAGADS